MILSKDYCTFNQFLDRQTRDLKGVNFIRFVGVDDGKKCSVVCSYEEPQNLIYPYDDPKECVSGYYGLHPAFSARKIITAIKEKAFFNRESFHQFLEQNRYSFALHADQQDYINAVYAQVILRMASRFGILFTYEKEAYAGLLDVLRKYHRDFVDGVTYRFIHDDRNPDCIAFLGGVTSTVVRILDDNKFTWRYDEGKKRLRILSAGTETGDRFSSLYGSSALDLPDVIQLCYGNVYYSGVLPRTLQISKEVSYSNKDVQTLKLTVERTTFATVDAFDYCDIVRHPLLDSYYDCLSEFMALEDSAQVHLFADSAMESSDQMIGAINRYLNASPNTHIIAVSGNITDAAGDLISAERSARSIDGGTFYCSVNGQSEFKDTNVAMYHESVNEDYPTFVADAAVRNDFGSELDRETVAELNIDKLSRCWEYYGISILGIRYQVGDGCSHGRTVGRSSCERAFATRRMHFNVLAHNRSPQDFESILADYPFATEKFESRKIVGHKIFFYKNFYEHILRNASVGLNFVSEYSQIFGYLVGFAYLMIIGQMQAVFTDEVQQLDRTLVTYLLAVVVLINALSQLYGKISRFIRLRPHISRHKYLASGDMIQGIDRWVSRFARKRKLHPIMTLMLSLYLADKAGETGTVAQPGMSQA